MKTGSKHEEKDKEKAGHIQVMTMTTEAKQKLQMNTMEYENEEIPLMQS